MPAPLNRHQPIRPLVDPETGLRLMYRLYPIMSDDGNRGSRNYRTVEPANQLCQLQLYRWSRSPEFVDTPSCRDLYDYLIMGPFGQTEGTKYLPSINHFGKTVLNALNYEPRKLKGVTKENPKACQMYVFRSPLELQYGLEYMICSWLRKFLNEGAAPGSSPVSGPSMMEEELDIIANTPWDDYVGLYVEPLQSVNRRTLVEPDWRMLRRRASADVRVDEDGIPLIEGNDALRPIEPKGGIRRLNPQ